MKKRLVVIFIFLFLISIISVSSQTIVQVPQEQEPTNYFASAFGFLKNKVILSVIIIFALVIAFLVGIFFLVRWLITFLKKRNDMFYQLRRERIKLASTHRRYPVKAWLKVHKNVPIRLVKKEGGKLHVSSPIGYYRGDYTTHEGNVVITMNIIGFKFWFVFPTTEVLIIPNREEVTIISNQSKKPKEKPQTFKLPLAKDIIQFNENEVLIFAESISNSGLFFVPVLKSKEGKIIDLTLPTYDSMKSVALGEYLYSQTEDFTKLAKRGMEINPYIRAGIKVGDTSQNVEIPSGKTTQRESSY